MEFEDFFVRATGYAPYVYQSGLANCERLPRLLVAATGTGKTEAAILGAWLWRRLHHQDEAIRRAMPRRLVYCLPMRTLVEQTRDRVYVWLTRLGLSERIPVTVLMGGEETDHWHLYPEQERIVIGTQDMLLSRALNRGYASSPFRWPWEFGLLNNDCLWVLDEVQLMANGLPTSTQVQAFREGMGTYGTCHTLWMSATVRPEWLETVDFPAPTKDEICLVRIDDSPTTPLGRRQHAPKVLRKLDVPAKGMAYDAAAAARTVLDLHQTGTATLVVVNTVARAQALYGELERLNLEAELVLVHSRFRPVERAGINERIIVRADEDGPGRIVVATQAIEAGVNVSARTLVTELAPWSCLVQRFGRCNRGGEYADATVYWVDLAPKNDKDAAPYSVQDLAVARHRLSDLEAKSVAAAGLPGYEDKISYDTVLRRRDLLGLFDTTADLSGSYVDVSRFVRGTDEMDVYLFWRAWNGDRPPDDMAAPARDELCSAPISEIRAFLGNGGKGRRGVEAQGDTEPELEQVAEAGSETAQLAQAQRRQAWRWNHLFGHWEPVGPRAVYPGQTLLLRASDGGYIVSRGWQVGATAPVPVAPSPRDSRPPEAVDSEPTNTGQPRWIALRDHSLHVCEEARRILDALRGLDLPEEVRQAIVIAARYHDLGKAHPAFQDFLLSRLEADELPGPAATAWAKRGSKKRPDFAARPSHFRHEVASGVALLSLGTGLNGWVRDLAAYLAAAHHGKVRLGMRSLPKARDQNPDQYRLLGFRVSDASADEPMMQENIIPAVDLGDGLVTPELVLDMSIARIGLSSNGQPSWLDRSLRLLDCLGPFRLAYLEALVRAADVRASQAEQRDGGSARG